MGINIKNNTRIVNAKLGQVTVNDFGRVFAVQYDLDGISIADINTPLAPQDIKRYLEGDDELTIFPVPSNVSKICVGAFTPFPNIETIYLFKNDSVVVLEDDLSYLTSLTKIYVPPNLLDTYKSTYSTIASLFDTWVIDYTLAIPYVGVSTLTNEYVDSVIAMLSNAEKNAITKVVIPTDFSEESANDIAWGYDFASYLPNLNDNIWYGTTQYDFTTLTILGSGTLTSAIVDSAIESVGLRINSITKVVIDTNFDLESVCVVLSDYDLSVLTNLNENIYYGINTCKGVSFATDNEKTIKLSAWLDSNCPYEIGDTRNVVYNNKTYTLRICDNIANRYELTNYSGKYNKLVIEFVELVGTGKMNSSNTNAGGWPASAMCTTRMASLLALFPEEWKRVMSEVSISSATSGSDSTLVSGDTKLFIPNTYEIFGSASNAHSSEQVDQFGWYVGKSASDRIMKDTNNNATDWWLRSPYAGYSGNFVLVSTVGSADYGYASHTHGVALCFAI